MRNPIKNFIEDIKAFRSLKKRNMLKYRERPQREIQTPGYVRGTEYQVEPIHYGFKISYGEIITKPDTPHKIDRNKMAAIKAILRDVEKHIVISETEDIGTKDKVFELRLLIGVPK